MSYMTPGRINDRHTAESVIESLYGWPEEYGEIDEASDARVIDVARNQCEFESAYGLTAARWRP